jgi:hypothetical protein
VTTTLLAAPSGLPVLRRAGSKATSVVLTGVVLTLLGLPAILSLNRTGQDLSPEVKFLGSVIIIAPAAGLTFVLLKETLNFAASVYWVWSFVFFGLAPAYQVASGSFPWMGQFTNSTLIKTDTLIIAGHLAVIGGLAFSRRKRARFGHKTPLRSDSILDVKPTTQRFLRRLLVYYTGASFLFIGLMGPHLFKARADFRDGVLAVARLPFGGTLYFVVTAGSIVLPAVGIVAYRYKAGVSRKLMFGALLAGAIVTNPLLGSRFLTGSFVLAVAAAFIGRRASLRFVPAISIVLLVFLFSSSDVLRGDGTGSTKLQWASPQGALTSYNFDAYEMFAREVSLTPVERRQMPSRLTLTVAPIVRWIPLVARPFIGKAGGAAVATETGMQYTNVSMPLWAEGNLDLGDLGTVIYMALLGAWIGQAGRQTTKNASVEQLASDVVMPGTAALLFILLRGTLYEVLGYLGLAVFVYIKIRRSMRGEEGIPRMQLPGSAWR